jgi:ligand-binding SRPBCC domain-containing protein
MARIELDTLIAGPIDDVFAAALSPQLHLSSMKRYGETMVEEPVGGAFTEGSTVTWRARHFGIPFRLRSVVFDIDPPRRFRDRQLAGPFGALLHEHIFTSHPAGTLMRDVIDFHSPFGPLGRLVDALFMRAYMERLIRERNAALAAEFDPPGRTLSA